MADIINGKNDPILNDEELENQDLEHTDEPDLDGTDELQEQKDDTVPLKTHLEVKRQNKQFKQKLKELESLRYDRDTLEYKSKIRQEYLDAGYEEGFAELQARHLADIRETAMAKKQNEYEDDFDQEVQELAESDEFFADAVDQKDKILAKIKDFEKKGVELSIEDAYVLVVNTRRRIKDVSVNRQQREILKGKGAGGKGSNVPTAGATKLTGSYKLSPEDRKALAGLQKMQPDAKWTEEKYYKTIHPK